mmetsp:Transcript_60570/g.135138  ORF Transcript_60570/g.135138 Transcript_60570/m.135138 type:complete len:209 (-) Transcript_60570:380-1006(-)
MEHVKLKVIGSVIIHRSNPRRFPHTRNPGVLKEAPWLQRFDRVAHLQARLGPHRLAQKDGPPGKVAKNHVAVGLVVLLRLQGVRARRAIFQPRRPGPCDESVVVLEIPQEAIDEPTVLAQNHVSEFLPEGLGVAIDEVSRLQGLDEICRHSDEREDLRWGHVWLVRPTVGIRYLGLAASPGPIVQGLGDALRKGACPLASQLISGLRV